MKKIKLGLIAFIVTCFALPSFAQNDVNPLRVGVKGGANFSNWRVGDDLAADNKTKIGLNLGLFAKLPVSDAVSIQPELLYSSKGSKLTYNNFAQGEGEYRFNFNYLELPVLGVFNIGENFNVHVGPYVAYLSSVKIKNMEDDGTIQGVKDLNEKDFNRFDYGLAGGVGFDFNGFMIGARYNYGLHDVGKSNNLSGQITSNSKNSVGTVYIGFGF
jgi:hypothetical protein